MSLSMHIWFCLPQSTSNLQLPNPNPNRTHLLFSTLKNSVLTNTPPRIQETLLHALHASSTNWPTLIQEHALSLLRSGDCTTFPELIRQVMSDIKHDTDARKGADSKQTNGTGAINNKQGQSLALPEKVIEEGLRVTRDALDNVVELDE